MVFIQLQRGHVVKINSTYKRTNNILSPWAVRLVWNNTSSRFEQTP